MRALVLIAALIATTALDAAQPAGAAEGRTTVLTNTWRGLKPGISTSRDVIATLGAGYREASNVTYGSITGLRLLTYDDLVVSAFLQGDRLSLIVMAPDHMQFPTLLSDWEAALGKAPRVLRSIRGKNYRLYVYSTHGLTATADNGRVSLVEIFEPMPPEAYEKTIYKSPPAFTK